MDQTTLSEKLEALKRIEAQTAFDNILTDNDSKAVKAFMEYAKHYLEAAIKEGVVDASSQGVCLANPPYITI